MAIEDALEHHDHAAHSADPRSRHAALLVAILAACLALTEVNAKRADIKVQETLVGAADAWEQYQAKSIRASESRNVAELAESLDLPSQPEPLARRQELIRRLTADQTRYERDEHDGKAAIAGHAHELEQERESALRRLHAAENAAAAMELGIVLATASAITRSRLLIRIAVTLGVVGAAVSVLAVIDPALVNY